MSTKIYLWFPCFKSFKNGLSSRNLTFDTLEKVNNQQSFKIIEVKNFASNSELELSWISNTNLIAKTLTKSFSYFFFRFKKIGDQRVRTQTSRKFVDNFLQKISEEENSFC